MDHCKPILSLQICPQENSSFFPTNWTSSFAPTKNKSNLVISTMPSIDIPPNPKKITNLNIEKCQSISIPPRPVYHPAIINACQRFFAKDPRELTQDEAKNFKQYIQDKAQIGEPLESEEMYLPQGGLRNCLHCHALT